MKKIYLTSMAFCFILLFSCSKDFLKAYSTRIVGTWRITDVNRLGFGGNTNQLTFRDGTFVFKDDGSVGYTDAAGAVYNGTWRIEKKPGDEESVYHSLHIAVANAVSQRVLSQYYDDMNFVSTDHFKARVIPMNHTYVTHFKR